MPLRAVQKPLPARELRRKDATRRPERQTSAVRCGTLFRWCHQHLPTSNSAAITSDGTLSAFSKASKPTTACMIIPIMSTVNDWLAILTFNPENVIDARLLDHADVN